MTAAIGRRAAMLADKDRIFTNVYGFQSWHIDAAMKRGDWDNTRKLLEIGPDAIIDAIKASGFRSRGGAGLQTGMKRSLLPKDPRPDPPKYRVINTDETQHRRGRQSVRGRAGQYV